MANEQVGRYRVAISGIEQGTPFDYPVRNALMDYWREGVRTTALWNKPTSREDIVPAYLYHTSATRVHILFNFNLTRVLPIFISQFIR